MGAKEPPNGPIAGLDYSLDILPTLRSKYHHWIDPTICEVRMAVQPGSAVYLVTIRRDSGTEHWSHKDPLRRRYYPWAELLRRVFGTDALVCPDCRGPRRLLAFLTDPPVVRKILAHLGMATQPPALARARPPPTQRATRFHGEVGDE